eukprot:CAMPEP_0170068774 /NCGR_PEP_ID=MMETSP0019_2-20121128/7661_1 /TAXON_ID=98059 /ORGANISM="Dinobryon sp., Strain UTEXLB2267" /LENGTH=207 /DNA_ID=CAMNT_0010276579 /DNA_START=162 /DNA_END=785 /DNA_ORIENTATION=+
MPRKIKRILRTVKDASTFTSTLLTPQIDEYLKSKASGGIYLNLMKQLKNTARTFKVDISPEFGAKPVVKRFTIVETAAAAGSFKTLVAAVTAAGLVDTLSGGLMTVLAPSDDAFAKLPEGTVEGLLADIPKLQQVLQNHVISSSLNSKKIALLNGQSFETLLGSKIGVKVNKMDNVITLDGSVKVTEANIKCSNGYIHVIDTVLVPK